MLGPGPLGVEWLRRALNMYEFAIEISRSRFRRENPEASGDEIEGMVQEMLDRAMIQAAPHEISLRHPAHSLRVAEPVLVVYGAGLSDADRALPVPGKGRIITR